MSHIAKIWLFLISLDEQGEIFPSIDWTLFPNLVVDGVLPEIGQGQIFHLCHQETYDWVIFPILLTGSNFPKLAGAVSQENLKVKWGQILQSFFTLHNFEFIFFFFVGTLFHFIVTV